MRGWEFPRLNLNHQRLMSEEDPMADSMADMQETTEEFRDESDGGISVSPIALPDWPSKEALLGMIKNAHTRPDTEY